MKSRLVLLEAPTEFVDRIGDNREAIYDLITELVRWRIENPRYSGPVSVIGNAAGNVHATYRDAAGKQIHTLQGTLKSDGTYRIHSLSEG